MRLLLDALTTAIEAGVTYLHWVGVLDDELLPPEEPQFPFVGLKDGGLVPQSLPGRKDLETLTVYVIAYQSLIDALPGASVMGATTQLGEQGTGLLVIQDDLKALLNDNFLALSGIHWAHRDRLDPSVTFQARNGRLMQRLRAIYTYRRYV